MPATATAQAPLTLVTGPESLLRDRAVAATLAVARAADADAEIHDLSAVGLEPGRLTALAEPSLFGGTTVLVLRDLGDAGEDVATDVRRLLEAADPDVVLVLVHHGGVKGKSLLDAVKKADPVIVECKAVKWESDKVAFVQAEFAAASRRVAQGAAVALVDALGSDLRELANACTQLISDTSGTVDRAVVERYYAGRVEVTGFKVSDAAVEGRYEEALGLLRHAMATGVDPVPVNAAFAAGLRTLAKVAGASRSARPDDVARDLGLAPFQVRKARGQLAGWTPDGVAAAILAVARADEQVKGGGTDPVYALERAVEAIVAARRSGAGEPAPDRTR
jgi:DNA polymerase-3 subunit delta